MEMVVGVGGDVVHESVGHELDREAPHGRPESAGQRSGRHRAEDAGVHEARQPIGVTLEDRAPLGMREHHLEAAILHVREDPLEVDVRGPVGALEQQVVPRAKAEPPERRVVELHGLGERDLRACNDGDLDLRAREGVVEARHAGLDVVGPDVVVVPDVGRRDHHLDPGIRGRARHRHAEVEVDGAVVEAREDVAVEVDHGRTPRLITGSRYAQAPPTKSVPATRPAGRRPRSS